MVQITVTAIKNVVFQDPMPAEGLLAKSMAAGTTKSFKLLWGQFQRVSPQLVAMERLGILTYTVEAIPVSTAALPIEDTRAQEADLLGLPTISRVSKAVIAAAGEQGLELQGLNVVANQTIASGIFGDTVTPDVNAQIEVISSVPGQGGNLIDFQIVNSGGAGPIAIALIPDPVTGRVLVEVDLVGLVASTYADINTALNGASAANIGLVYSTLPGTGAGTVVVMADKLPLSGGTGMGMSMTLCDEPCVIRTITLGALPTDPQLVLFDSPDLTGIAVATEAVKLVLRSGAKMVDATITLV